MIAWAPEDRPTEAQIEAVLDKFEETAWAGLEPDRYAWSAVEHRERGGGVHVHIFAARCDLETGKSLNIAPPGWQKTFGPLRDAFNLRARLEPARRPGAGAGAAPARTPRLHRRGEAAGRAGGRARPARVAPGLPRAACRARRRAEPRRRRRRPRRRRNSKCRARARSYVTVHDPESGQRWRLKGALYEHDFNPERLDRPGSSRRLEADERVEIEDDGRARAEACLARA